MDFFKLLTFSSIVFFNIFLFAKEDVYPIPNTRCGGTCQICIIPVKNASEKEIPCSSSYPINTNSRFNSVMYFAMQSGTELVIPQPGFNPTKYINDLERRACPDSARKIMELKQNLDSLETLRAESGCSQSPASARASGAR